MPGKNSKEVSRSIGESRQYHTRHLRAINSPLRRRILRALKEGEAAIIEIQACTGLASDRLKWHLGILAHGLCVERSIKQGKVVYKLTQEGRVVDYV